MIKKISIYVRNKEIDPSSYYRIIQYAKYFDGEVCIREAAPKNLYVKWLNLDKNRKIMNMILGSLYYIVMLSRVTFFLSIDCIVKPNYLIVSRTFCPRYTPIFLNALIKQNAKKSKLYWDFDDCIFLNGEISKKQASVLEDCSTVIVVTNIFLKVQIKLRNQSKVILLSTTDGDLQGFNMVDLTEKRRKSFDYEIRLIWVATSSNIPNILKVISILDKAADKLKQKYNKKLILVLVCNKPLVVNTLKLEIKNVLWTREKAKEEIYNAHIGIMPLINNKYSLGKGGFKLIQYMSTGLPVVASNVGYNTKVVDLKSGILVNDKKRNDDWSEAILKISSDSVLWKLYSINAYKNWNSNFSFNNNLVVWQKLLQK